MECPECHLELPQSAKFCMECGCQIQQPPKSHVESERKHVTIMFSDLSGYTAMTERLDPEDVKEIMSQLFGKITEIIKNYDGFIERFIGDAVMAVFGVPQAHEDDPVRAIRAAIEIKSAVEGLSPQFEDKIGQPLTMHTGINTGLVVTGEVDVEKGTHGLTGDAINLASRLEGIAKAGEIIVGPDSYSQASDYFEFETLAPTAVKGKQQPVAIYRVASAKKEYFKTHRLQGFQASLIGRDQEVAVLSEAVSRLNKGRGSVISIKGDAGTGKSRLKKEFKDSLDLDKIQWREGHAYGYTQNMPYYPLINLLTHAFQIEESDPPDSVRKKLENGATYLLGEGNKHTPYIGSLFALSYEEIEGVSPEYWKDKLGESIQAILSALIEIKPTIICFEDLHWADPSFIELFKQLVVSTHQKALFLCTYRAHFSLFNSDPPDELRSRYQNIYLKDLARHEAQGMLESLLGTNNMPVELKDVVNQKAEGNPFYIEEMINSLIESEILIRDNGNWKLSRMINENDIPATIHGVLTERVDRLGRQFKRILQEASVIGRSFFYRILLKVTDIDSGIDQYLSGLEGLDLIRAHSVEPELEYIFKHALTQEVVYNGLLKTERQAIHERIGLAIERLFVDRLPEFYETLAHHFSRGKSILKASDYLSKSGEKCLRRYAVEESHRYFEQAFGLIGNLEHRSKAENDRLIDVIIKWALVFYYRGDFAGLKTILTQYAHIADSATDPSKKGMFKAWQGFTLYADGKMKDAYRYLHEARKIGESSGDLSLRGYAYTWIAYACAELGLFEEGIRFGEKGHALAKTIGSDHYLYFKSQVGISFNHFFRGCPAECGEHTQDLIEYCKRHSQGRGLILAYCFLKGPAALLAGDFVPANKTFEKAKDVSIDPFYRLNTELFLALGYLLEQRFHEAGELAEKIASFSEQFGVRQFGTAADMIKGICMVDNGQMSKGMNKINEIIQEVSDVGRIGSLLIYELTLGRLYLEIVKGNKPLSFMMLLKNCGFIIKHGLSAKNRAEQKFKKVISDAITLGADGFLGQAHFDLATLYAQTKQKALAREHLNNAIPILRRIGAYEYLAQAKETLQTLGE